MLERVQSEEPHSPALERERPAQGGRVLLESGRVNSEILRRRLRVEALERNGFNRRRSRQERDEGDPLLQRRRTMGCILS